tara:strand:- start:22343 stop:23650 length:1308 start_codon:yes stop_codon:yes gene_type:complete
MADETTVSFDDLLYDMRGPLTTNFPKDWLNLAELNGVANERRINKMDRDGFPTRDFDRFSGKQVRVPLLLAPLQGTGGISETGAWNPPHNQDDNQANITMARVGNAISVTPDLEYSSMSNSAAEAVALQVQQARIGMARVENEMYCGLGDGQLGETTAATTGTLVVTLTAASFNAYQLYPGRIVDILVRATGANAGSGLKRKIASIDETASTVTFETAATTGGDAGVITSSVNDGIYIEGTYGTANGYASGTGGAIQGIGQAALATGTFEGIDKAAVQGWQGVDGRAGSVVAIDPTISTLDGGVRALRASGIDRWDYAYGSPGVVDKYQEAQYTNVRWGPVPTLTLDTGFTGIDYRGRPLLAEDDCDPLSTIYGVNKEYIQPYSYFPGPDWLDDDGALWRRYQRGLPREAVLLDFVQLGFTRCNTIVRIGNLNSA